MVSATPPAPGRLHALVDEATRLDRSGLAPVRAAVAAAGIAVVLVAGLGAGDPSAAVSMAAGALLAGVSSMLAGPRPAPTMAGVSVAMGLATFCGSASGAVPWLHLLILVPWAFAAGISGVIGREASTVGLQSAMAMIVFGRFSQPVHGAAVLAAYVAAGGAVQLLLAVLTTAAAGTRQQRHIVAEAYEALAGQARTGSTLAAAGALEQARAVLATPALFGWRSARPLLQLVHEGERIRLELAALTSLAAQQRRLAAGAAAGDGPMTSPDLALEPAAERLQAIASALGDGRRGRRRLAEIRSHDGAATGAHPRLGPPASAETGQADLLAVAVAASARARLAALDGQLRAATRAAADVTGASALPEPRRSLRRAADRVAAVPATVRQAVEIVQGNWSLSAPQFRHALRLMVVLPLCELVATLAPLQRGYWIALTAGVVLRPDYGGTVARGVIRVAGTLLGVGVASAIMLASPGHGPDAVLVVVLAFATLWVFQANYALFSSLLTALVVVLISIVSGDTFATAGDRLVDTVIGGAIALLAYRIWPTWSAGDARGRLSGLVAAQRRYVAAVLAAVCGTAPRDDKAIRDAARAARLARSAAEDAVGRSLGDPGAHRLDAAGSAAVLSGLRRLVMAAHRLRTDLEDGLLVPAGQPAGPLAAGIDEALAGLDVALRCGDGGALQRPPLRRLHDELAAALGDDASSAVLLAVTDEMVDALNSAIDATQRLIAGSPAGAGAGLDGAPGRRGGDRGGTRAWRTV